MMRHSTAAGLFLALTTACSSSTTDTSKLVGTWTYQPGSTIAIDCPNTPSKSIDLSTVVGGHPGFFTLSAGGPGTVHEVDARGCTYDWSVTAGVATAAPGQSCATFPDGRGGNQLVHLQTGTKSTSDGASMTVDVHFTNDASCTIAVTGTANHS
jgi:hypothetical protein